MIRFVASLGLATCMTTCLAVSVAAAAPAGVQQAFGNTIVSTYPDGRTGKLWLKPGGTYTAQGRRGDMSSGRWRVKGQKLCLKQSAPLAVPLSFCTPAPKRGMDHSWAAKAVTGEDIRVQMVKGHV